MAGYERDIGLRRDDALLLQVRFENTFLSVRPIVLSLARSTMFISHHSAFQQMQRPSRTALGPVRSEQASAISVASAASH